MIFLMSRLLTNTDFRKPLFRFVVLLVKRWLAYALYRLIFPFPVILNLFAAPRFVFNFGILKPLFNKLL